MAVVYRGWNELLAQPVWVSFLQLHHQPGYLRTAHFYSLLVLEIRNLKSVSLGQSQGAGRD